MQFINHLDLLDLQVPSSWKSFEGELESITSFEITDELGNYFESELDHQKREPPLN